MCDGHTLGFDIPDSTSNPEDDEFGSASAKRLKLSYAGHVVSSKTPTLQRLLEGPLIAHSTAPTHIPIPANAVIITVNSAADLINNQIAIGNQLFQIVPHIGDDDISTHMGMSHDDYSTNVPENDARGNDEALTDVAPTIIMPPPSVARKVHRAQSFDAVPKWVQLLKGCELIGSYYRGYVESELDMENLLNMHKQCTRTTWGTRQSPSPAKPSTRLMWKSQYVPFDGIPFVNSGSRAVVMECQFGPRRRGSVKHIGDGRVCDTNSENYTQTCPARIYVKRVRKFTAFAVNTDLDKKSMRCTMDTVFQKLREGRVHDRGVERYYIQLPTEDAHDFHDPMEDEHQANASKFMVLHPRIIERVRELVAGGETRLYVVRRHLRWLVTHDLFPSVSEGPERHNLTYFPTVNCLKNHIHQALKDIEAGTLPVTASAVSLEIMSEPGDEQKGEQLTWRNFPQVTCSSGVTPETVTVTVSQNPNGEPEGHHEISRVETHLSDGSTKVSSILSSEMAQLLAKLHPFMFSSGGILKVQSPGDVSGQDGQTVLPTQNLRGMTNLHREHHDTTSVTMDAYNTLDVSQSIT